MNDAPVAIAIIGLGSVADSHLAAYRNLPEVKIAAVVDPRPDRTREVAARLGVPGVPGVSGAFVICGSSDHGFKLGPAVGEEVTRLVTGGRSELLQPFKLERFSRSR